MIRKTVTIAASVLVVASFALFGCGSSEESTEEGIDQVQADSVNAQPQDYDRQDGGPQGGGSDDRLALPPGKISGK